MEASMIIVDRREILGGLGACTVAAGLPGAAFAQAKITPSPKDALIVVDIQKCFLPGGSLAVDKGDEIVPLVNNMAKRFQIVILTQDWHTPEHISFASSHPGKKKAFETVKLPYGTQVLWPDHCVQGTEGAEFASGLSIPHAQLVIRKGHNANVDSYSAFLEADNTKTGLDGYLKSRGVTSIYACGLATDFCVAWTALDARKLEFNAAVIEDLCRGIDAQGSLAKAWAAMKTAGVKRIQSSDFA
jgi:nicotinamidase/pyrazinamidase